MNTIQLAMFPMKNVSISQRCNSNYSHKYLEAIDANGEGTGKEYGRAPTRVKVLAVLKKETTGFNNTVLFGTCDENGNEAKVRCADGKDRILTFAFTHDDNIDDMVVGAIYQQFDVCYMEGTKGDATGNHIHIEVGEGWQYKKRKDSHGNWCLLNLICPEDIFFLKEGYHTVTNYGLNGYSFPVVDYDHVDIDVKPLPYGFSEQYVNGVDCYFYKLNKETETIFQRMSEPEYSIQSLKEVLSEGVVFPTDYTEMRKVPSWVGVKSVESGKVVFVMPFNFFEGTTNNQILGRCQGENVDKRPDQEAFLDSVITKDFELMQGDNMGQFASWEYMDMNDILIGNSPALMLYHNGTARKLYSDGVGWNKYNTVTGLTVMAQDGDSIIIGIANDGVKPQEVADWLFARGCSKVNFGDGGGSAYCCYNVGYFEEPPIVEEPIPEEPSSEVVETPQEDEIDKEERLIDLLIKLFKTLLKLLIKEE